MIAYNINGRKCCRESEEFHLISFQIKLNFKFAFFFYYRLGVVPDVTLRFVTNTTKESKDTLLARLTRIGFTSIKKNDMFTSLSAAVEYVRSNRLQPFYLLTDDAKKDFIDGDHDHCDTAKGMENSVVVGLAPEQFNYENMNHAFR